MPIFKWIRDLFGIRKDWIEAKKTKLEIKRLEEERRGPSVIEKATFEDMKKYDPVTINLLREEAKELPLAYKKERMSAKPFLLPIIIGLIILILLIGYMIIKKYF